MSQTIFLDVSTTMSNNYSSPTMRSDGRNMIRQWAENGKLLGKFRIVRGTGLHRAWHDNGQLQIEVSLKRGQFCGRSRMWLRDGTLLSDEYYLHGKAVTAAEYRQAARRDRTLPRPFETRL